MNYTSARYDGPWNAQNQHQSNNMARSGALNGSTSSGSAASISAVTNHSASSSLSSLNGDTSSSSSTNMAGVGSSKHNYDSSGDFDRPRMGGILRNNASQSQGKGTAAAQQYQYQQLYSHRKAQNSDDYERIAYPQHNNRNHRAMGSIDEKDSSLDLLLSPGLAPVGPISQSSSNYGQHPFAPPPTQPPPPLPSVGSSNLVPQYSNQSNSGLARPALNRSQTAAPAMSGPSFAKAFPSKGTAGYQQQSSGAPLFTPGLEVAGYNLSHQQQPSSERTPTSNAAGGHSNPPPAIAPSALLELVLKMRVDDTPNTSLPVAASPMARSHSANAAVRLQQAVVTQQHVRNTSTGSNRSEDESQGVDYRPQGLQPPQHPGMTRTASSKTVTAPSVATGLETVDLSHQRIAEMPEEVIQVLEGSVSRLALSYNYLLTLPDSFAKLGSTLRYLNIRLNFISIFPQALTEMPSLEILDISRNKLKRLPVYPGSLRNLRVFSISKNRIKRLPAYIADMTLLRVLKVDHNPLEWPPKEIVAQSSITPAPSQGGRRDESGSRLDEAQALQQWLNQLQAYIREHASEAPATIQPLLPSRSEDILFASVQASQSRAAAGPDSNAEEDHGRVGPTISPVQQTSIPAGASTVTPPIEPLVPTNATQAASTTDLPPLDMDAARMSQHGRNASHSLASGITQKRALKSKKSLPDLRQNHAQILDERFNDGDSSGHDQQYDKAGPSPKLRIPIKHNKSPSSTSSATPSPVTAKPSSGLPTPPRSASSDKIPPLPQLKASDFVKSAALRKQEEEELDALAPLRDAHLAQQKRHLEGKSNNQLAPSGSTERGSSGAYFRRLSMLPALTTSKTVPLALLAFIDGVRGLLFSLSQIYSSLKQFVVFPAPDRLPSAVSRTMASADDAMGFLIDALDRFDASSRRKAPETSVVREVLETCRENVNAFAKLVNVISTNTKALFGPSADVRYTRTLILALYGAMGEISNSWSTLGPLKNDVIAWLAGEEHPLSAAGPLSISPVTPHSPYGNGMPTPTNVSPVMSRGQGSPTLTGQTPLGKQRMPPANSNGKGRRHAGSFTNYNSRFET